MKNINSKIQGLWCPDRIKKLTRDTVIKLLEAKEKKSILRKRYPTFKGDTMTAETGHNGVTTLKGWKKNQLNKTFNLEFYLRENTLKNIFQKAQPEKIRYQQACKEKY